MVELGTNPSVESVFLQEAGLLWRLRHRNIVGLSGVSVSGSQGILFMVGPCLWLLKGGLLCLYVLILLRCLSGMAVSGLGRDSFMCAIVMWWSQ